MAALVFPWSALAVEFEITHRWTSGGEATAVKLISDAMTAAGMPWVMMRLQTTTMCGPSSSAGSRGAILRLLFRTYLVGVPETFYKAVGVDWAIFLKLLVTIPALIVFVVLILQLNEISDDFLFGAIVACALNWPMTKGGSRLSVRVPVERRLLPGTAVHLRVDMAKASLFDAVTEQRI